MRFFTRHGNFWWFLRWLWHAPQFWSSSAGYDRKYLRERIWLDLTYKPTKRWRIGLTNIRINTVRLFKSYLWSLALLQPFSCKGDVKCWQTHFCEWLEMKARNKDETA